MLSGFSETDISFHDSMVRNVVGITAIAHRGASAYAPENTFAAFDLAVEIGIRDIELDVQFTSDSHIVVIHDEVLDRTTDATGPVSHMTLKEIQQLDAGSWFDKKFSGEKIHTLGEVFDRYNDDVHFHIEIKSKEAKGLASRTCELVREYGRTNTTIITSFWKQWLIESRAHTPDISTGWLVPLGYETPWNDRFIEEALDGGFSQICPRANLISKTLVQKLHDNGFDVRCWGVSDEVLMEKVTNAGADGMTINFPDRLYSHQFT
jgi:glycerophosphoryl diester phosphodiesterase